MAKFRKNSYQILDIVGILFIWQVLTSLQALGKPTTQPDGATPRYGVCTMFLSNNTYAGNIEMIEGTGGVVTLSGGLKLLPRSGQLGLHFHEYADLSNELNPCDSMGKHFNPTGKTHGCPGSANRHAGDLGNIMTDSSGTTQISVTTKSISLNPMKPNSIIGRGLVIHMGKDDCGKVGNSTSLENGNSGKRIACCIIGFSMMIIV